MDKYLDYMNKLPEIKTTVNWFDLYQNHYIILTKDFQKQILGEALSKSGNRYINLSNKIGVSRRTIAECYKLKNNLQIWSLIKILAFTEIKFSEANKEILKISGLKPKFPFFLGNKSGVEIRAAFLSDGHVPKNPIKNPMYCASELELHERLIKLCKGVFGNFIALTKFNKGSFITRFPAPINSALYLSGIPRGDKRIIDCHVPKDILLGPKYTQRCYLRRVFDDEGDVCLDSYGKRAVRLTRSFDITRNEIIKPKIYGKWITKKYIPRDNLIFEEFKMLSDLGINPKIYSEGVYKSKNSRITAKWRIQIAHQNDLRKFQELINFTLKDKKNKLIKVIKSYKIKNFHNYEGEKIVLKIAKVFYKKRGYFTFGDIGKELIKTGRSYNLAGRYIKILSKRGVIQKIKRGKYIIVN